MQNTSEQRSIPEYWEVILRRRKSMFLVFLLVWVIACVLGWMLPPRYRSQSTIHIQQPQVPQQYVLPNVATDMQVHLETLVGEVLSRPHLQRIIDDLHLYSSRVDGLLGPSDPVQRMRKDITVAPTPATEKNPELASFTIAYSGFNPQLVEEVATRLTSLFVEENARTRQQESENTTDFLDRQLQQARTHLEEEGKRIKDFKTQFDGQLPGQLQSNLQILSGLQSRLQEANEGVNRAEEQKLYLTSMLNAYRDSPSVGGTGGALNTIGGIDAELGRLQAELAEAKSRYTDFHPTISQIRDEITQAEKLKAELKKGDEPESRAQAEIESQLKGLELDMQNRKKEIAALQSQMQIYESRLNKTPEREQQLADLSGDYDQDRINFDLLVKRRNESALATNMEKNQQGEQFIVLDSPSYPGSPYFPNRLEFTIAGLTIGLAAAVGILLMRETLDDRVHGEREVSTVSTVSKVRTLIIIPPLTTVKEMAAAKWRTRREVVCAIVTVVAVTCSTLLAFYYG